MKTFLALALTFASAAAFALPIGTFDALKVGELKVATSSLSIMTSKELLNSQIALDHLLHLVECLKLPRLSL